MNSNFRTDKKNMDWRIIHELWMRFCYQTQKPTTTEIRNIIEDLQPLLCELETELDSQAVKTWFGNTRQRPYPSLSIQDIDSAQVAHAHLISHVPIVGAAKKRLNAWQQKKKVPAMTADQKAAKEQQKLEKKSSAVPKPVTAARQPHIQQPQLQQPQQICMQQPQIAYVQYAEAPMYYSSAVPYSAVPMYYQSPLLYQAYQQFPVVQPEVLQYSTGQQFSIAQPMQPVRPLKMGRTRVHVDRDIRHHPYAGHYMSAPQTTIVYPQPVVQPAVPQPAVQQPAAQQSTVQQSTVRQRAYDLLSSASTSTPWVDDDEEAEFLRLIGFHK